MIVIVLFVLIVNLLLHRPVIESLLFAVALAVGMSPELLPAIVSVTLSAGARAMAGAVSSSAAWKRSRISAAWIFCAPTRPAR